CDGRDHRIRVRQLVGGPGFEPGASCSRTVLVECPRVFRWLPRGPPELKLPLLGVHPCSPTLGCGRPSPISASIETDTFDNERPQRGFFDRVTLVEVDGTNRLAVKTRVEEALRILQLGTLWKRQPHRVLEGLADADDAVVGPDGHPLGAGGLLPLHLFDYAGVGAPDQSPQLAQPLTPPAGGLPDDGIDLLGRGRVVHADALPRRLSTQRTEGLSSLSFRCVHASQQHGRRFPSSSSDRSRSMCWLLVSAFFGQSTQQIHSLRARGVRSSHAARAFGMAIKTRLKSIGTVWTTPPE